MAASNRKAQLTGMLGVYLTAAELTNRGFIVSPTSRSAAGADLLVTDQKCQRAFSVQVKTQRQAANFWLVGSHAHEIKSQTHIYVFINLRGDNRPDYLVVPSEVVADKMYAQKAKTKSESTFCCFDRSAGKEFVVGKGWGDQRQEGWETFGSAS
jgi:hypothetical protein